MSVKESLYSQYDGYINGEKLARNAWLAEKILSTSVLQKTRGRMTQHDQVAESSYRPLPSFFGKKLSRGFKINTKFAGVD